MVGPPNPPGTACTAWADGLLAAGHRLVIPEIIDYQVRRELLLRHVGQPTAGDDTIDIDIILIAQAFELNDPNAVVATGNVGHIARFFPAEEWSNITP